MIEMKKICVKCKIDQNIENFHFNDKVKGTRKNKCKTCIKEYFQSYKYKNREMLQNKWRLSSRKYQTTDKRRNKTLRKYGLTEETYNNLFDLQHGKCKICSMNLELCVDHCHTTGNIRGLLCNSCNVGLGCFKDNIELLEVAINYLTRNGLEMKPAKDS